jgi:N-carbamoyl-L-amino-acid hydrolase
MTSSASRTSAPPRVNGERLLRDLDSLAKLGATPEGGVNRPAYGDVDLHAREVVRDWMKAAGLAVRIDAAGNTFGRREGSAGDLPPIVIGSHTDSVPHGGKYDGPLGTLAALEVARTLREQGISLRHPLEVVNFQNEEGGIVGSKAVAGKLGEGELALRSVSGFPLGEGIRRLGGDPDRLADAVLAPGSVAAYVELHIEQGRFLERGHLDIGVVEGIVGIYYWEVTFTGTASHAGTTPMADRHDALVAAARCVELVQTVVTSMNGRQVGTVGRLAVEPGAPNVIPGRVTATLELRDLDTTVIDALYEKIVPATRRIAEEMRTSVNFTPTTRVVPALTDHRVRAAIGQAARALGLSTLSMPSGAGHDAQNMSFVCPSGMIFVPSADGISHSPREYTKDEDVVNGANVLLGAVLGLDAAL